MKTHPGTNIPIDRKNSEQNARHFNGLAEYNRRKEFKHQHEFTRSTCHATVETCCCGKFRFTEHAGPSIIEVKGIATDTSGNKHN